MDDQKFNNELIDNLVKKRLANFDYIKRVHQGTVHWMNTVLLSKDDIRGYYNAQNKQVASKPRSATIQATSAPKRKRTRTEQWFYIGISLAPLLELESGDPYIAALSTFWTEFEHWKGSGLGKKMLGGMKDIVTVNAKDMRAARTGTGSAGNEFLNTSNIPSTLDTFEVVFSLCDLLEHMYRKFVFPSLSTVQAKNIVKLDARFKHHFIGKISKDMSNLALSLVKQQMSLLDKNLSSGGWEEVEDEETVKNK